jgi:hypothetical protein
MTPDRLDWLKANKAIRAKAFKKGCAVRGSPGRASENWIGVIVGSELHPNGNAPFPDGRDYWQVRWMEREQSPIGHLAKAPIIGHLSEQLVILEN